MKTFKIEGWYRYNDEKDFEQDLVIGWNVEEIIDWFKEKYNTVHFYKIDIKEIV